MRCKLCLVVSFILLAASVATYATAQAGEVLVVSDDAASSLMGGQTAGCELIALGVFRNYCGGCFCNCITHCTVMPMNLWPVTENGTTTATWTRCSKYLLCKKKPVNPVLCGP